MLVRHLDHSHIGETVTLPTLQALGRCRRGTLHKISLTGKGLITLQIGNHLHTIPDDAVVHLEVRGL